MFHISFPINYEDEEINSGGKRTKSLTSCTDYRFEVVVCIMSKMERTLSDSAMKNQQEESTLKLPCKLWNKLFNRLIPKIENYRKILKPCDIDKYNCKKYSVTSNRLCFVTSTFWNKYICKYEGDLLH